MHAYTPANSVVHGPIKKKSTLNIVHFDISFHGLVRRGGVGVGAVGGGGGGGIIKPP